MAKKARRKGRRFSRRTKTLIIVRRNNAAIRNANRKDE